MFRATTTIATLLLLCLSISNAWVTVPISTRACLNFKSIRAPSQLFETEEDDTDGWGEPDTNREQLSPIVPPKTPKEPDRDMFIPIFAVVSILGLFGSYGYEMIRLNSRGELYLPWN